MALDLGLKQDIAFYDALYVQVALELQLPFLTADWPLFEQITASIDDVRAIYPGSI